MLTEPLTDYLRFELGRLTSPAIAGGEDIRILTPEAFEELAMPRIDFWIFDDNTVGVLHFGDTGVSGVEVITEPDRVGEFLERKRRAIDASIPYRKWATRKT